VKRPKSRTRKLFVTDELVELFRKAIPAEQALWREVVTGKEVMTEEQRSAARAAVYAFDRATDRKPWEHSPLSPRANGPLQSALLAKLNGVEAKAWRRYVRQWWKRYDEEMAGWEEHDRLAGPARRARERAGGRDRRP
jgi:hypothetical protein